MLRWVALVACCTTILATVLFAYKEDGMKAAPYGSWKSPISAKMQGSNSVRFSEIELIGETLYWLEGRPTEGGRVALMSWTPQQGERELLTRDYSVRNRVHEYGGGAVLIGKEAIYFVNDHDQQIYSRLPSGQVQKVTNLENTRFADGNESPDGGLFYVMEEHGEKVVNTIVRIDPSNGQVQKVAFGNDFYSSPRVSPDGKKLAFVTWHDPNMPWDGTELWVLDLQSNEKQFIAGGVTESVVNPQWSQEGELYFISDRSNWWNLYSGNKHIWAVDGELTYPQWTFGESWVGFSKNGFVCTYVKNGSNLFAKQTSDGTWKSLDLPFTAVAGLSVSGNKMAILGASATQPLSVILYDLSNDKYTIIKSSRTMMPPAGYISKPVAIEFPTTDGRTSHAFYYPPCNPDFKGMPNEKPPLLVMSHGGPTAHQPPMFNMGLVYWTSRGFGVAVVNYGGSTGYGRDYRERLKGNWGVVDVDDCTNAALYCSEKGLADRNRLTIEGGSAGGYTTLAVLAFRDVFKVGADYFGVSDLERLAIDTHKFEARYLDLLVGPYPEQKALYLARSPLYHVDQIKCPVIIFQGAEDAIVPPEQSEVMYQSLLLRKIPTAYLLYAGEQHGFRKAENIERSLEAQLYFFSKVLGFSLSENIEPVDIQNFQDK